MAAHPNKTIEIRSDQRSDWPTQCTECGSRAAEFPTASIQRDAPAGTAGQRQLPEFEFVDHDTDWDGEAYLHGVGAELEQLRAHLRRRSSMKLEAAAQDWYLTRYRTDGAVGQGGTRRLQLWDLIAQTRPGSAPTLGVQYDSTPSTSGTPAPPPGGSTPPIPCSEYMFLDDTACNLASLNLVRSFCA